MSAAEPLTWAQVTPHVPDHWQPLGKLWQSDTGAFGVFSIPPRTPAQKAALGPKSLYVVVKFYIDENGQMNLAYVEPNVPTRLTRQEARELAQAKAKNDAMPEDRDWDEVPD